MALAGQKRAKHQIGRAHLAHDVIIGVGVDRPVAGQRQHLAFLQGSHFGTQRPQQLGHGANVAEARGIGQRQRIRQKIGRVFRMF